MDLAAAPAPHVTEVAALVNELARVVRPGDTEGAYSDELEAVLRDAEGLV